MYQYKCKLPKNFDPNNPEFDIFKDPSMEYKYGDGQIKNLKNVRIANNNVVFNYFNIIEETCCGKSIYDKYNKDYKFYLKFIFPKINFHPNKRFILIADEWTTNYYHWHLFALHRLLLLKEANLLEDSILFLPIRYKKFPFVADTLKKFGIKKEQILYLRRKSNIKVKELFFIDNIDGNHPEMINQIRERLVSDIKQTVSFGDKIYISRERSPMRYFENEDEFVDVISKYGFKKVIMEDYSYEDQISISSNAKYIIGAHGAGLTNMLFMKQGGKILEFASGNEINKPLTDYFRLASIINIDYLYQYCDRGNPDMNFHGSMIANLDKVEKDLQLMLS